MPRSVSSRAATGTSSVEAVERKPAGAVTIPSPWLIHTSKAGGTSAKSTDGAGPAVLNVSAVRPYSPLPLRSTTPPSC